LARVSVIMPAFNAEQYLASAIESVLGQTYRDLELIMVDDGSTDGTLEIARDIARRDERLTVVTQPNSGRPAPGRNRALAISTGKYVSFLDADDHYLPDRVRVLADALDSHPSWIAAFHDLTYVNKQGIPEGGTYLEDTNFPSRANEFLVPLGDGWFECNERFYVFQSLYYAALHTQTVMIARERVSPSLLRFDEQFLIVDDTDLWIRLGFEGRMGYLNQPLSCYRRHDTNITGNKIRFATDSTRLHVLNYNRVRARLTAAERTKYHEKIASYSAATAFAQLSEGLVSEARANYRMALKWSFTARRAFDYMKSLLPPTVRTALKQVISSG
jgi:glycosyltransferase involved in cell wall biosynthesis